MSKAQDNNATATTARQWQILSQLDRKRWLGTAHIKEQLDLMGFDISLRTIPVSYTHLTLPTKRIV